MPGIRHLARSVAGEGSVVTIKMSLIVISTLIGNFSKGECRVTFQIG